MKTLSLSRIVGFCLALAAFAAPARAQVASIPPALGQPGVNGVLGSVAYDDKHGIYFHVWENSRRVYGQMIGRDGIAKGVPFQLASAVQTFAGSPKVGYSAAAADDVFFVLFCSDYLIADRSQNLYGQIVRHVDNGTTGAELVQPAGPVAGAGPNFPGSELSLNSGVGQVATDVVFNPNRRQFLAVWQDSRGGYDVFVRLFSPSGAPLTGDINVTNAPYAQGQATAAYDWRRNRYLIAYQGIHPNSPPSPELTGAWAKILDGDTAQPVTPLIEVSLGGSPIEMQAIYLPEKDSFLMLWTAMSGGRDVVGRLIPWNWSGPTSFLSNVYPIMASAGAEGGADGVYSPDTRTVLVAMMSDTLYIRGTQLNAFGDASGMVFQMSTAVPANRIGSFYPWLTVASGGQFGMAYGVDYTTSWLERFQGTLAATPGPRPGNSVFPNPALTIDGPLPGPVAPSFTLGGWAIDRGATSGTGVDTLHVWAWPVGGGNPTFLGVPAYGIARPDVGAAFGAQFTNSGYSMVVQGLPLGTYQIVVYLHSTLTGTFVSSRSVTVSVSGPAMSVDAPRWLQTVPSSGFLVGGWAIDRAATSGIGVDAVHVWAWPTNGGLPVFCGVATFNQMRPDVGAIFGQQFTPSGYNLWVNNVPPGTYTLVVYAHSAVTRSFSNSQGVLLVVR